MDNLRPRLSELRAVCRVMELDFGSKGCGTAGALRRPPKRSLLSRALLSKPPAATYSQERLLDDLMHEEKLRHPDRLGPGTKCAREMAVDEDGAAVRAVTGDIGNVIGVTDPYPAPPPYPVPLSYFHRINAPFVRDIAKDALCVRGDHHRADPRRLRRPARTRLNGPSSLKDAQEAEQVPP
jgi:hypothetical protein